MSNVVQVHIGRTEYLSVDLGEDVSGDVITSQIRTEPNVYSPLIASWVVVFTTDGTDGELTLSMDEVVTAQITATDGYMDIKRVTGGKAVPVFDKPLKVEFIGSVTA